MSRNLDMPYFAHKADVVIKEEFSIRARKTNTASNRGKRKIIEILDFEDGAHDEANPQDPNRECTAISKNNGESDSVEPTNIEDKKFYRSRVNFHQ